MTNELKKSIDIYIQLCSSTVFHVLDWNNTLNNLRTSINMS